MITFHLVFTTKFSVSQRLDAKNEDEVQFLFYTEAGCAYFGRRARRAEVSPDFSRDQNDRGEKAGRRLGSRRCGPEARSTSSEGPHTFFMKFRGPSDFYPSFFLAIRRPAAAGRLWAVEAAALRKYSMALSLSPSFSYATPIRLLLKGSWLAFCRSSTAV